MAFWHFHYRQWGGSMLLVSLNIYLLLWNHVLVLPFQILPLKYIIHHPNMLYFQNLTLEERVDMPSYNLAETIYNRWLQHSRNTITCLYEASIDDFICVYMQIISLCTWLKGWKLEKVLIKLQLCQVQQIGDPKMIAMAVTVYSGALDIMTKPKGLEGAKIFGSTKWK